MDETGILLPDALKMTINANPPKSESFINDIALKTANYYLKVNKPGYALQTAMFIAVDKRIHFYKSNEFVDECIDILQRTRRLKELYCFLKGHNKLEEGANIAKKFNDTNEYVMFVLLIIRSKLLQNANIQIYSRKAQQSDAKELHLLLKVTHDYHLEQQLLYFIALLEGKNDWYNTHMKLSAQYLKIKAFDLYIDMFKKISVLWLFLKVYISFCN